jgi:serine protease Do
VVVAAEMVGPAVANIHTERIVARHIPFSGRRENLFEEFFREFFGTAPTRRYKARSLGSGIVIDPEGYIITNAHVVSRATRIGVTLRDKREFQARLINLSPGSDVAVLKIDAEEPLPFARMGNSSDVMMGETVIALGNPFGLENTVTVGVLSARNRSIMEGGKIRYRDFLQTDAAINPGNSGGPLINVRGEIIGINTAIYASGYGIGFATPIDRVRKVLVDLTDHRELKGIWLGIRLEEGERGGVRVARIEPGGPAAGSGLRTGDRIVALDRNEIDGLLAFQKSMLHKDAGDKAMLGVRREGGEYVFTLVVKKLPRTLGERLAFEKLGILVRALNAPMAHQLGLAEGGGVIVLHADRESPAAAINMRQGDVITKLGKAIGATPAGIRYNLYSIRSLKHLGEFLQATEKGDAIIVYILRHGQEMRGELRVR